MKVKKFVFKFLDSDTKTAKNIIIKVISIDAYQWKENESEMKKDENWKKEKFQKLCEWKSNKDYEIYKQVCLVVQEKLGKDIFTEYKLAGEEKYSKDKLVNLNISKDTRDKLIRENYCGMKKVLTFIKGSYKATENCLEDWTAMYDNKRTDWHFVFRCEYENDTIKLVEIDNTSYRLDDVNKVKEFKGWKTEAEEQKLPVSLTSPIETTKEETLEKYNNTQQDVFSGGYGCKCSQKGTASSSSSSSSSSSEQDGGYGIKGQGKGRHESEKWKANISKSHKGKPHPHKGVKENAQWRENISKGERASYAKRYGVSKKKSKTSKTSKTKKTASKQKGGFGVPEQGEGRHETPEQKKHISEGEEKSYKERYGHPPLHSKSKYLNKEDQDGGKDKYLKYKTKYLNLKNSLF